MFESGCSILNIILQSKRNIFFSALSIDLAKVVSLVTIIFE